MLCLGSQDCDGPKEDDDDHALNQNSSLSLALFGLLPSNCLLWNNHHLHFVPIGRSCFAPSSFEFLVISARIKLLPEECFADYTSLRHALFPTSSILEQIATKCFIQSGLEKIVLHIVSLESMRSPFEVANLLRQWNFHHSLHRLARRHSRTQRYFMS
jgi:hypothetical protein